MADGIERRQLLAAGVLAGGVGAASVVPRGDLRRRVVDEVQTGLIDVHHHILPPNAPEIFKKLMSGWSAPGDVAEMNTAGVATAIAWAGSARAGDVEAKRRATREYNEFGAKLAQDYPGRFGLFAALPFPDVDGCAAEIDYALDHLHADGFGITTSYEDLLLGDRRYWPIYEKLASHDAVVFVHPTDMSCCGPVSAAYPDAGVLGVGIDGSWIEWPMNTARTILSLMVSGTLRQFPRIRFIFCHGGGVMPLLVNRIVGFAAWPHVGQAGLQKLFPDGIQNEFRTLHFECAQACSHTNMDALRSLVPDSQIMFGSDYPFFPIPYGAARFRELDLPPATQHAIGRGNAVKLLPRWA